ncbi:MAG: S41 family peptidase [Planctomycetota bacterium]
MHVLARILTIVVAVCSIWHAVPPQKSVAAETFAKPKPADSDTADAGLLRTPDISKTQIVFAYADALWIVSRDGGTASPLADAPGVEASPRFSPDGTKVAFTANYEARGDLYELDIAEGTPVRRTFHPAGERLYDWVSAGDFQGLVFESNRDSGLSASTQLFVLADGQASPQRLAIPYGSNGAVSPDGKWIAYTPISRDRRTWKRYRGGMASDVWLVDFAAARDPESITEDVEVSRQVTDWEGTDSFPMWNGNTLYYLSDAGPNHRLNLWKYNLDSGEKEQVTQFVEFDVKNPSIGPGPEDQGEIVFQCGPSLYRLDLGTLKSTEVRVRIPGDRPDLRPMMVDASDFMTSGTISPSGKRIAVSARGDIWSLPKSNGIQRNLTASSGSAERYPSWSPDGQWIAYLSDASGEYELCVTQSDGRGETKTLTADKAPYRYDPVWSPDSKWIAMTDKAGKILLHEIDGKKTKTIDQDPWVDRATLSFSSDSRWLAYDRSLDNEARKKAIFLYDLESGESHQFTSGYFNDTEPAFSPDGKYLYFQSDRHFESPEYDSIGTTFVYQKTTGIYAIRLNADVDVPMTPETDEVTWEDEESKDDEDEDSEEKEGDSEEDDSAEDKNDESDEGDSKSGSEPSDPISGTWQFTIDSVLLPASQRNARFKLEFDGKSSVSGNVIVEGESASLSGTFDPETGRLELNVDTPIGQATVEGTVKDGSFSGKVTLKAIGMNATITGNREDASGSGDDDDDEDQESSSVEPTEIDLENADDRVIVLPVNRGRYGSMAVNHKNQLLYLQFGSDSGLMMLDLNDEKPSPKKVVGGVGSFELSADRKQILVSSGGRFFVVKAASGQSLGSAIETDRMKVRIDRKAEWNQIYNDAWRMFRDFFYDAEMHGVDWLAVRDRYDEMMRDAASRWDVAFIIREMISELNVGHAYYRPAPEETDSNQVADSVAVLAAEFEVADERYRVKTLYRGGPWDTDAQNPLAMQGVGEGQFLLQIDGFDLSADENLSSRLEGMVGKPVELTFSHDAVLDDDDKRIVVKPMSSDAEHRFRHWIESNRKYVEEKSGGKIGYIYVKNTSIDGQDDLVRQFYAQMEKDALLIDERWNGGGQIPTRFIELLNRPATNWWARRDGRDWRWPPDSHQGPKAMLINGRAGSGGDMFPGLFRDMKLGSLIGRRTWGGLVGISGGPRLIDGASVNVPTFAYYENDGTWGIEGHGVDPDIEVIDDPGKMLTGSDPQLDVAIEHLMKELDRAPYRPPAKPKSPDRSGMGIPESDR